jgi:hypothetical protein
MASGLLERVFQDNSERFLRNLRDRVDRVGTELPVIKVRYQDLVGKISNLPKDLIHENSEQNMVESMEIKQTMFTRDRYEHNMSSISKSIASPRN